MAEIFVTSDTFFGRENIIKHAKRDYQSVEEMNDDLVERWNETVDSKDTVYHLGNFAWDPFSAIVLHKLNGKIVFLNGTYDKALKDVVKNCKRAELYMGQILEIPNLNLVMCHYPLAHWNGKDTGTLHLHGHTYDKFPHDVDSGRINVCIDCWNLSPVSITTLHDLIEDYRKFNKQ